MSDRLHHSYCHRPQYNNSFYVWCVRSVTCSLDNDFLVGAIFSRAQIRTKLQSIYLYIDIRYITVYILEKLYSYVFILETRWCHVLWITACKRTGTMLFSKKFDLILKYFVQINELDRMILILWVRYFRRGYLSSQIEIKIRKFPKSIDFSGWSLAYAL